jgi:hypothetical protein
MKTQKEKGNVAAVFLGGVLVLSAVYWAWCIGDNKVQAAAAFANIPPHCRARCALTVQGECRRAILSCPAQAPIVRDKIAGAWR